MSLRLSAKHAEVSLTAAPVDFHTHLLPCMDDGSVSPLESRRMLDIMCADGVSEIVLTPHFYPDRESPDTFLSRRAESVAALRTILRPSDPRLYLGAEVAYYVGIGASRELAKLCVAGTSYMLLEMPFDREWCSTVFRDLEQLGTRGVRVIIAHVERYPALRRASVRRRLEGMTLLMQSNAESFLSRRSAHRMLKWWKQGSIHILASDCHHADHRPPELGALVSLMERRGQIQSLNRAFDLAHRILGNADALNPV